MAAEDGGFYGALKVGFGIAAAQQLLVTQPPNTARRELDAASHMHFGGPRFGLEISFGQASMTSVDNVTLNDNMVTDTETLRAIGRAILPEAQPFWSVITGPTPYHHAGGATFGLDGFKKAAASTRARSDLIGRL
jgi:hypothetical protein